MILEKDFVYENKQVTNGAPWSFSKCWECAIQQYGLPIVQYCVNILYAIYSHCTPINVALFLVKTVPWSVYVFNLVRSIYRTSRERMKLRNNELEDLQLQVQIVNTKLSVRDAEYTERAMELRRATERLQVLRARVLDVIAANEELQRAPYDTAPWDNDSDTPINSSPEECEFIVPLLKELKRDRDPPVKRPSEMSHGEQTPPPPSDPRVYSSISDNEYQPNCRVKIVKVTNVYKVACLKHYIKQKKLRRASKQATLKKKMENVKKLLSDWQKMLNMAINKKLSIFNVELASQEAMGDYSTQDLREFSDSDSDLRNFNDNYYEQPSLNWTQNSHGNFKGSFEDSPDTAVSKELINPQYEKYQYYFKQSECSPRLPNMLFVLPEETNSQVAIEEMQSEAGNEYESSDLYN